MGRYRRARRRQEQMADTGLQPRAPLRESWPWIPCQELGDIKTTSTVPQTNWGKYIPWPHMNLFFHDSFPYRMELSYAEMTLLKIKATLHLATLMWQKPGTLPGYTQHWGQLFSSSLPSQRPMAVSFIFHPNQCLNPKWSLNTFLCPSPIREPAAMRAK